MMVNALYHGFTWLGSEWVMWILMVLSIVSVAIIFERWKAISKHEKAGAELWETKVNGWMREGASAKVAPVGGLDCVENELLEVLSRNKDASREDKEKIVQSFLGKKKLELERYLAFLGTVGSNAPFVGLFGTVLGIIRAFKDLGENAQAGGVQTVSSGLAEALVATAVGLLVAIPAVAFYNFFQRKIKTVIGRAESLSNFLLTVKF